MRRAAVGLIGAWLVVAGGGRADAQTSLIPPPPGHVKVTVEFRQVSQSTQGGITAAVILRQVGTALVVRPTLLPDRRIRLKITPQISYRSDGGSGTIELVEAATEVVVQSGQPMTIAGSGGGGEVMRQFLLGYERVNRASQVSIVLTAESP
ncbi:MAG: hypothetical protein HY766_08660 [candidate division NC10 bacterium]|nr:hypothetical protein [candidate division NC10 bacterium]